MEGNDLRDNIDYDREKRAAATVTETGRSQGKIPQAVKKNYWNLSEGLLEIRRIMLVHSNLVRAIYSYDGHFTPFGAKLIADFLKKSRNR